MTEALRLLRSLDLPATAALGANNNTLQPSAVHSVTIQDMEGRLPPLALQILREEQQTPSQDPLQRALSLESGAAAARLAAADLAMANLAAETHLAEADDVGVGVMREQQMRVHHQHILLPLPLVLMLLLSMHPSLTPT
ncbi:unnamed protein product [Closterium sp. Naga37s-1]|nr:unnamed protein product [Closterium sp. Naga37s-1]